MDGVTERIDKITCKSAVKAFWKKVVFCKGA